MVAKKGQSSGETMHNRKYLALLATNHCFAPRVGQARDALCRFNTASRMAMKTADPRTTVPPSTTIDWQSRDGVREIPIEERDPEEVSHIYGVQDGKPARVCTTANNTPVSNYAFDVTPARLVTGLITERGICDASAKS